MSSNGVSDGLPLDLERDVPTTAEDVRMLRTLRGQAVSWLQLSATEIDALLPPALTSKRPPFRPDVTPFTLE